MDFFQDINSVDIVGNIARFIKVEKSGSNYKAVCPFHDEKTPSLVIFSKTNTWRCFGCGEGSSNIDFVMKRKNMTAWEAACEIANANGIPIPDMTPENKEKQDQLEKLSKALEIASKFFIEKLATSKTAKAYLAGRWKENIIHDWQLGYAPEGFELVELAKSKKITTELLTLGVLKKSEKGVVYSFFQDRVIIPVHDANGRMVAFTGRKMNETDKKQPKYINTQDSILYKKGNVLFGLNRAMRNIREKRRMYLVEGNPDVITLHSLNKVGTVCSMGTALTDEQISVIKKLDCMVVVIGDTDSAGQKATDKNSEALIRAGIGVSIVTLVDDDGEKHDPDSFFKGKGKAIFDTYVQQNIRDYIITKATLQANLTDNNAEFKSRVIDEIAELVACYTDTQKRKVYIEELSKIIRPKSLWTGALKLLVSDKVNESDFIKSRIPSNVSLADVERYGFYSQGNCYFFRDKEGFHRGSNFVLQPLFHVQSMIDAKRLYQITNDVGITYTIEVPQRNLISLPVFKGQIEGLGNFVWEGSDTDLTRLKRYLYANTQSCIELKQLGWQKQGFWAWSNGIFNGRFTHVDEYGIAAHDGASYYIPAHSKIFEKEDTLYVSERRFRNKESDVNFSDYAKQMVAVFGENAKIGIAFYIASVFRDFVFKQYSFFPILNLFGPKGAGKTEMAVALMQFFGNMPKGPNMSNSTLPALSDHIAMTCNACTHIDEYKNSVDFTKVEFLKGLWDGTGRSRMNMDKDKKKEVTSVDSGVILSGQEMPTADIALFSRLIFLSFTQTEYSQDEKDKFKAMQSMYKKGLTHITNEILSHRKHFIQNFVDHHDQVMKEMGEICDAVIEDRIMRNWCIVLGALRTLEDKLNIPFTFDKIKHQAAAFIRRQNSEVKKGNEVSIFWDIFQFLVGEHAIEEKVDYKFEFTNEPKTDRIDKVLREPITVIYVRKERVFQLYRKHGQQTKENILPIKTMEYYLMNSVAFLGIKKVAFKRSSNEGADNNVDLFSKRIVTPAFVFDYEKLNVSVAMESVDSDDSDFVVTKKQKITDKPSDEDLSAKDPLDM